MLETLTDAEVSRLAHVAERAISTCLTKAAAGGPKLPEVPAVETVVRLGMRMVARQWRRTGLMPKGTGLALQSIFTHAAPKVRFDRPGGGSGRCELADLLIVVDDPAAVTPQQRRRGVLVQAKLHDSPGCLELNDRNERVQFELLSSWPEFKLEAGFYRPHDRDLKLGPSDHAWSGEYGGIDQPPPGAWTQYHIRNAIFSTSPPVSGAISLGQLLAGMLAGKDGYGRAAIPLGRDPWSELLDELLNVTFNRPLRNSRPKSKRGRSSQLGFVNLSEEVDGRSILHSSGSSEPPFWDSGEDEWPDGAISIVRLIVGERFD